MLLCGYSFFVAFHLIFQTQAKTMMLWEIRGMLLGGTGCLEGEGLAAARAPKRPRQGQVANRVCFWSKPLSAVRGNRGRIVTKVGISEGSHCYSWHRAEAWR